MESTSEGRPSELIDLTNVRLADLRDLDATALARSIVLVVRELERPQEALAGFGSAI
jgi:FXSXX-COOH protein